MEEIITSWSKIRLSEEESTPISVSSGPSSFENKKFELCVLVRVLAARKVNINALKKTMRQIWRLKEELIISEIGPNILLLQFFSHEDKRRVIDGRPWTFDDQLLLLKEVEASLSYVDPQI